jgi:glycine/D-amino acid oxidase-like deaminating enzyme
MDRRRFAAVCAGAFVASRRIALGAGSRPRVLIVGAGIVGASIAYHLARRGADVTLVEKQRPAAGATGSSFAWINSTFSKQPRSYFELNRMGMAAWARLAQELAGDLDVQWNGAVEWYPPGADAERLRGEVRRHQQWGYAARLLDGDELPRLLPGVSAGPVGAGAFSEHDGAVDPVHAVDVPTAFGVRKRLVERGAAAYHRGSWTRSSASTTARSTGRGSAAIPASTGSSSSR